METGRRSGPKMSFCHQRGARGNYKNKLKGICVSNMLSYAFPCNS